MRAPVPCERKSSVHLARRRGGRALRGRHALGLGSFEQLLEVRRFASSTISHSRNPAKDRRSSLARASAVALISGSIRSATGIFVRAIFCPCIALGKALCACVSQYIGNIRFCKHDVSWHDWGLLVRRMANTNGRHRKRDGGHRRGCDRAEDEVAWRFTTAFMACLGHAASAC